MPTIVSPQAKSNARALRHAMTDGEKQLWSELRQFRKLYGVHVRRQVPIGPYVADFAVHSSKHVIELDGEFHFTEGGMERDKIRDAWFADRGYSVLRINTGELSENFDGCIEWLLRELEGQE